MVLAPDHRVHYAECPWLYGLDAKPDGSYNQDAVTDDGGNNAR
jgi:hypothetical protein